MGEKIFGTLTRTATNVFVLGLISAAAIFTSNLMIASGQRFSETVADDLAQIRSSDNKKAA